MLDGSPKPPDPLGFAALVAHQLRSPVVGVSSILNILRGEYAGAITPKQKELLDRACARCDDAVGSVQRMLAIANAAQSGEQGTTDLVAIARKVQSRYAEQVAERHVALGLRLAAGAVHARGNEPALAEALDALASNALKYTPEHGRIEIAIQLDPDRDLAVVTVADSGVGVPEADRNRIFDPFYRSTTARSSARPGVGLGLAFVRNIVEGAGGTIRVERAEIGGAAFVLELPAAPAPDTAGAAERRAPSLKVVIIGGVAAGPKVAAKVIRLVPDADVTIVEKQQFLSYAGCGLPYYISGVVKEQAELMSTGAGVARDPVFFQQVKNVHVLSHTEAVEIDRAGKRVRVREIPDGDPRWLDYDKLVLATGSRPVRPPLPGVELEGIFTLHGVRDAEGIRAALAGGKARDVLIVGGGLIGVETTEALVARGSRVTIVEMEDQILRMLDPEMSLLVTRHLESKGVRVMTGVRVEGFAGDGQVRQVRSTAGPLPADLVILAIGVRPNVDLARDAGLEIGETGAIRVNDRMQTTDPDVYASGDCAECVDLLTRRPVWVPLGSTANKQGRVAAINLCGGDDTFPGILGSTVCKVFNYCVARTGLTETRACELGYDVETALAPAPDRAHFMPEARPLLLKLVVDRESRRLLGAQATGPGAADKRIDVAALAITAGMTIDQLANADLCYAPPYAPAMDNLIVAANVARNKVDGVMHGVPPLEVHRLLRESGADVVMLDVRTFDEFQRERLPGSVHVPLGALRGRLDELPRDRPIITFCKISLRGYEAALILKAHGFEDVRVMDGGLAMWPFEKEE
jgi:NADPH-dependent 2,4-dienoyl-CoA reductase/sulfur reductase-like enzyme/rhodanese-related sulfurtransferase/two-component sensor histidine kinase